MEVREELLGTRVKTTVAVREHRDPGWELLGTGVRLRHTEGAEVGSGVGGCLDQWNTAEVGATALSPVLGQLCTADRTGKAGCSPELRGRPGVRTRVVPRRAEERAGLLRPGSRVSCPLC